MSSTSVVLICTCILLAPHLKYSHAVLYTWLLLVGSLIKEVLL